MYSDLQVTVQDNGVNPRDSDPSSITINILNENDNPPEILPPLSKYNDYTYASLITSI